MPRYESSKNFGGPILLPDGTQSAPALSFAADTDVGLWRSASDTFVLQAGSSGSITSRIGGSTGLTITASRDISSSNINASINQGFTSLQGFEVARANGQLWTATALTELTTIAAAATTDTAIQIPVNMIVFAVSVRVTTVIPTAATFTVTGTSSGTTFNTAAVSTAANSTDVGTLNCPYKNVAAQTIRITPNLTPVDNTGRVRVTIHYYQITPATS